MSRKKRRQIKQINSKKQHKKNSRAGSKGVKLFLIQAYGGCICDLCGLKVKNRQSIQMHHLIRVAEGGPSTIENGSLLCEKCHHCIHKFDNKKDKYYEVMNRIIENKTNKMNNSKP